MNIWKIKDLIQLNFQISITEHSLQSKKNFDWKYIKVLDSESNYNKKLILEEEIHIKEKNLKKRYRVSLDDIYGLVNCE